MIDDKFVTQVKKDFDSKLDRCMTASDVVAALGLEKDIILTQSVQFSPKDGAQLFYLYLLKRIKEYGNAN